MYKIKWTRRANKAKERKEDSIICAVLICARCSAASFAVDVRSATIAARIARRRRRCCCCAAARLIACC
jgi:hypothetical protein